jgi:hypothetical protein
LPIQPIWPIFAVNGLDWQCCFAGSCKTAPRILIFSIAIGADYSFELNFIETYAPTYYFFLRQCDDDCVVDSSTQYQLKMT